MNPADNPHAPLPGDSTRPAYRVPIGLPLRGEGRRAGLVVSVLAHFLVILIVGLPFLFAGTVIQRLEQGAGGAGPAGGGGGGRGGMNPRNYTPEKLRYVRIMTDPVVTPTTIPPVPKPVVVPPIQPPVPQVVPAVPEVKPVEAVTIVAPPVTVAGAGDGPGTGRDGTTGNGPGSGGGVGSGIGTGRGSGVGPGTGGGNQVNYPPQPIEFFLPPLPPPASVRGFRFIAEFDVDSTGRVLDYKFSETRDGNYNRRIASVLRSMRFRPGTGPNGMPLRMKAQVGYEF